MENILHLGIVIAFIVSFLSAAFLGWQVNILHWLLISVSGLASILSLAILVIAHKHK